MVFFVHTTDVTKSVVKEFKELTGFTINEFLQNEIIKQINANVYEAKQAKISAIKEAQVAEEALKKETLLIQMFTLLMSVLVFELGVIITIGIVLPGWWKLIGLVIAVGIFAILNHYLKGKEDIDGI